jgi:hypothetical protein
MPEFVVRWSMPVEADNAKEAAEQGWALITDAVISAPDGATVLTINPMLGNFELETVRYTIEGDGSAVRIGDSDD